jgi:hypothetical protein
MGNEIIEVNAPHRNTPASAIFLRTGNMDKKRSQPIYGNLGVIMGWDSGLVNAKKVHFASRFTNPFAFLGSIWLTRLFFFFFLCFFFFFFF